MQAVILAAGRGTRMGALTDNTPKPMMKVGGKNLLEHKFDALPDEIDEIIIIVGYLGGMIQKYFGGEYNGKRIFYIEQEVLNGTAGALELARPILHDRFLILMGDDLYAPLDIERATQVPEGSWAIAGLAVEELGSAANIEVDASGVATAVVEAADHGGGPGYVNTGLYTLDMRFFDYPLVLKSVGSNEYGLPQTMIHAGIPIVLVPATSWIQITAPEDIERAEEMLSRT